jgi:hypothetical protein
MDVLAGAENVILSYEISKFRFEIYTLQTLQVIDYVQPKLNECFVSSV